jgi:hypothetical protein
MKQDVPADTGGPDGHISVASQYCRLPRLERMREVMRAHSIRAQRTADTMAHTAEDNWRLRRLLGELLRDTGFIAVLDKAGIRQIPRMLLSRIVHATQDRGPFAGLETSAGSVTPAQEQTVHAFAPPAPLPGVTSECLARMSDFRRCRVLALMHQTGCFTGDFALAFLAASPMEELTPEFQHVARDGRHVASLIRYERKLQMAVRIIDLLAPDHPLMLVERTLHLVLGRQLLSQPAVRTWLQRRAPEYIELLVSAGATAGPARAAHRSVRVAG